MIVHLVDPVRPEIRGRWSYKWLNDDPLDHSPLICWPRFLMTMGRNAEKQKGAAAKIIDTIVGEYGAKRVALSK